MRYPYNAPLYVGVLIALAIAPQGLRAAPQVAGPGTSAQQSAVLRGRVYDAATGDALHGAIIRVPGTAYETVTNREGNFQLANLPAGSVKVRVDYVGYENFNADVVLADRQRLDVAMNIAAQLQKAMDLDTVQVMGYRGAQSRSQSQ